MKMRKNEYDLPFVLNLAEDNHITMASVYHIEIPEGALTVNEIPDESYPIADYRYENGDFIYDPLPELEPAEPGPTFFDELEAQVVYTGIINV